MYDPDMARKARDDDEDYYAERAKRIDEDGQSLDFTLRWLRYGETGYSCEKGSLLRWRDVPRGRWQYAYWRGQDESGALIFSLTPNGPIVRWTLRLGSAYEVACVVASSGAGRVSS